MKKLLAALLCVVCLLPGMALAEDDLQVKLLDQWQKKRNREQAR